MKKITTLSIAVFLWLAGGKVGAQSPLVWDSPGKDFHDAIPLGNGDIGISAWTEQDGEFLFYISKTDAYDDDNRLVKLGKVRLRISPDPFVAGRPYREELNLRKGDLTIRSGTGADQVDIRIWVDANNPVVRLSVAGKKAFRLSVALEDNRKEAHLLQDTSFSDPFSNSIDGSLSTIPAMSYPDSILNNRPGRIIWYHHNTHSCWPAVLRLQGLDDWVRTHADPLQDRIFGGCISGKGLVRADDTTLVAAPAWSRTVTVTLLTAHPATSTVWLHRLDSASSRIERQDPQMAVRAHRDWWERFWDRSRIEVRTKGDTGAIISRGYALQRWLIACGGRGTYPTKFNGSIFTLPWENPDPDYRRWGSANWFQNVRLLYWPLIAAGDFDLLAPFFGQYLAALPLATARTAAYYHHGGAFFSETSYAWGTYTSGDYGFDRTDKPPGFVMSTYMRHYWSGGLELSAMMFDQYAVTRSRSFLADTLLPIAGAVVRFYDEHWHRGPDGKIRFDTAQSLETWQTAVNPMPEIAGLKYVLGRLMELPHGLVTAEQRAAWTRTLADLPAVPSQTRNDSVYLMPADSFGAKSNSEDPELYAVFPYRLYDIGQPSLQTGLNTFAVREFRDEDRCWWQDEIQAACLGLAYVAADGLAKRFRAWNSDFRFPAMWGPNNDEIPDLDHGGAGQIALQYMLMQSDGEKIYLFPAWPLTWDASFKLYAPGGTIVRGELRQGRLQSLEVTPETRRKDIIMPAAGIFAQDTTKTAETTKNPETPDQKNARMDWWRKARFGMFIHWGVYAVPAGRYHGKVVKGFYEGHTVPSAGEWIMHDAKIPRAEYQQFAKKFNPTRFDPDAWVRMAKEAGMKYIVITSKHHEGFAMFDSKASDWGITQRTPYKKDVIKQLAEACRRQGMKLGLYYSQANDWNNPGGAAEGGHWDSTQNGSMDDYLKNVAVPQVREILENYGDIAELWWDVPTGMTPERAALFLPLLKGQPGIITNNRLGGGVKGDIETPEQYIPATGIPGSDWETCMTMNDTWGYKIDDHHWKSATELIRNLVDIASKGGNYLLNVGPEATGEFPEPIIKRLHAIGRWMGVNSESIYGTTASPFRRLDWGRCTKKINDDGTVFLYLQVFHWPKDGVLRVPGLRSDITSAGLLARAGPLRTKRTDEGWEVFVPAYAVDTIVTVIKLMLKDSLKVDPVVEKASPGGSFFLGAEQAEIHNQDGTAEAVSLEEGNTTPHIGFWSDPQNWVSWNIRVKQPGLFTVKAIMASPAASGKMTIRIGDQILVATQKGTGDYYHFREIVLGKIAISQPGVYQVAIQPQPDQWQPFNLQQISLVR